MIEAVKISGLVPSEAILRMFKKGDTQSIEKIGSN